MSGNLENVGFALPEQECIYNIDIMEETVSNHLRLVQERFQSGCSLKKNLIERAPNVKDLKNYIDRTEEMADRKKAVLKHAGRCLKIYVNGRPALRAREGVLPFGNCCE